MNKPPLIVQCKCCPAKIEVKPPDLPDDIPNYATVLKRGNVLCEQCFRWLSKRR